MTNVRAVLSGYQILDPLHISSRLLLYRGVRLQDDRAVLLKVLWHDYPSFRELLQLRHQYALGRSLTPDPHIARPLTLESYRNGLALVLDDPGGVLLNQWCNDRPLSLSQFFPIALSLSRLLQRLHRQNIIHKSFHGGSFLVDPHDLNLTLIDLSLASRLPRETQSLASPSTLEGVLAYLSPEQTGRMNRGLDYRTDFYALGVTFYQLLTGQLPFQESDPMGVVHAHLAKMPPLANQVNGEVPIGLTRLVLKLMSKMPEDRYQSAAGLSHDLEQCWQQWKSQGTIGAFPLGQRDVSDRFVVSERIHGRQGEITLLLEAFDRASNGETVALMVTGASGVGKTALIHEVQKPIVRQRGYFIRGKCDQFQPGHPFQSFILAFQDLVQQLIAEGHGALAHWRQHILEALGEEAQALVEVIPSLESLLGPQPPIPTLAGRVVS